MAIRPPLDQNVFSWHFFFTGKHHHYCSDSHKTKSSKTLGQISLIWRACALFSFIKCDYEAHMNDLESAFQTIHEKD